MIPVSECVAQQVAELADLLGLSPAEVIAEALALLEYRAQQHQHGALMVSLHPGGSIETLPCRASPATSN